MPTYFPLPPNSPFASATPAPTAPPLFGVSSQPPAPPSTAVAPPVFAQQPTAPPAQPRSFAQAVAPIAAAFLAGGGDPIAMGRGMAAFMRGRQMRRQERE